jgi:hypothetical protein
MILNDYRVCVRRNDGVTSEHSENKPDLLVELSERSESKILPSRKVSEASESRTDCLATFSECSENANEGCG